MEIPYRYGNEGKADATTFKLLTRSLFGTTILLNAVKDGLVRAVPSQKTGASKGFCVTEEGKIVDISIEDVEEAVVKRGERTT